MAVVGHLPGSRRGECGVAAKNLNAAAVRGACGGATKKASSVVDSAAAIEKATKRCWSMAAIRAP